MTPALIHTWPGSVHMMQATPHLETYMQPPSHVNDKARPGAR